MGGVVRRSSPRIRFRDRAEAGRRLAERVAGLGLQRPIVLALPRGGVPIAAEVATTIDAPLDVLVVRKVGAVGQPELAVGAIAEDGDVVLDERGLVGQPRAALDATIARERAEVTRRIERYRDGRPLPDVRGAEVVVVDDGLATGMTAEAAVRMLQARGAARVVLAVPVAARASAARLRRICDVVTVGEPSGFGAVGAYYDDFRQVPDEEVLRLLRAHGGRRPASAGEDGSGEGTPGQDPNV
jgi:putative phosphoribosyl transferase